MKYKLIYKIKKHENELIFRSSSILKNSNQLLFSFPLNDEKYQKSLGGYGWFYFKDYCTEIITDPVYLFHFMWENNYEHWVRDTIFLLEGFYKLKKKIPNLKLLRYKWPYHLKFHEDVLKLILDENSNKTIYYVDTDNKFYLLKNLYLPYVDYSKFWYNNYSCPYELKNIYDKLIKKSKPFSKNDYPKKVYLSRRNLKNHWHNRTLVNEDEVANLLIENGYTEVFSDELSFTDEINLFNNVEKVVTPIGAGCANLFFANKYSKWCIIVSDRLKISPSLNMNKDKIDIFKDTEIYEDLHYENSPYECNIDSLKNFLEEHRYI